MKAVIYARYSSDRQREESIEGQLRECQEYADRNGLTVVDTYIDRALSAAKGTDKRLDFLRMIHDSAKHMFDVVLVWKLDRFARSRTDSAKFKAILKSNGVRVVSATESISDSPEGIILEAVLEGIAEYYSAELSEKIHRGLKENALKAQSNGGPIPLGYVIGPERKLIVDPPAALIVQEIFERYADGETIKKILDDLNRRGIKTGLHNAFSRTSLSKLLSNRKYLGEYRYMDIVIPGGIPQIITQDLFDRVQWRRESNKRAPGRGKAKERYLLSTKLFCGKCGRLMVGESGRSKTGRIYNYYKCVGVKQRLGCDKKAVRKEWIEDLVVRKTYNAIMDDALMDRLVDTVFELQDVENPDVIILQKKLAQTQKKINNLIKAIEEGIFSESTQERLNALEAEKKQLNKELLCAEQKVQKVTKEQIRNYVYGFRRLDPDNQDHRQKIIDNFVNSVHVFDDKILLVYNYKDGTDTISLDEIESSNFGEEYSTTNKAPQTKSGVLLFVGQKREFGPLASIKRTSLPDALLVPLGELAGLFLVCQGHVVMAVNVSDGVAERQHRVALAAAGPVDPSHLPDRFRGIGHVLAPGPVLGKGTGAVDDGQRRADGCDGAADAPQSAHGAGHSETFLQDALQCCIQVDRTACIAERSQDGCAVQNVVFRSVHADEIFSCHMAEDLRRIRSFLCFDRFYDLFRAFFRGHGTPPVSFCY